MKALMILFLVAIVAAAVYLVAVVVVNRLIGLGREPDGERERDRRDQRGRP